MRSIFGWSYPPGCSGPPDDDAPCLVCGELEDTCICPECPKCGSYGDPKCYKEHGLIKTQEQILTLAYNEALWEDVDRSYEPYIDPESVQ